MNAKTSADHMADISHKLDVVLGFLAIRGMEGDQGAIVDRLSKAGHSRKVIAAVTGLTEHAVKLRQLRAKGRGSKKVTNQTPVNAEE